MTIKKVCIQTGLTVDTIRYYERVGLVKVEKGDYFKNYNQQTVDTLRAIKKLRLAGLSIDEIKWLVSIESDATELSRKQLDSVTAVINNAIERAKIRAREITESQQLLEKMKNKLIKVSHETD